MPIYNTNAYRLVIDSASLPADGEIFRRNGYRAIFTNILVMVNGNRSVRMEPGL